MSLYQCKNCGCVENTALSNYWINEKSLCSACDPEIKKWHGIFTRTFLEKGAWKTNSVGNLEHKATGATDYHNHQVNAFTDKPKCAACGNGPCANVLCSPEVS